MKLGLALLTGLWLTGCATNVPESRIREVQMMTQTGYYTYLAASSARRR